MAAQSTKHLEKHENKNLPRTVCLQLLENELQKIKLKVGMGSDVNMKWLPGATKQKNGQTLLEEVLGNTILIYAEDLEEAKKLLAHGFIEWLLNQHTRNYRLLINKLIEVYEQIQYDEKEKIADAISKILIDNGPKATT